MAWLEPLSSDSFIFGSRARSTKSRRRAVVGRGRPMSLVSRRVRGSSRHPTGQCTKHPSFQGGHDPPATCRGVIWVTLGGRGPGRVFARRCVIILLPGLPALVTLNCHTVRSPLHLLESTPGVGRRRSRLIGNLANGFSRSRPNVGAAKWRSRTTLPMAQVA